MLRIGCFIVLGGLLFSGPSMAQHTPKVVYPLNWQMQDKTENGFYGAEIDKAYEYLKDRQPKRKVIVAVIDGGIDASHPDLKENLWVNPDEIPGNGIDDDRNGYVDDIHGWNFLGNQEGKQINNISLEADREYLRLKEKFQDCDTNKLSSKDKELYHFYKKTVLPASPLGKAWEGIDLAKRLVASAEEFDKELRAKYPGEKLTREHFLSIIDKNETNEWRKNAHFYFLMGWGFKKDATWDNIYEIRKKLIPDAEKRYEKAKKEYSEERNMAGDDLTNIKDRYYGNNNLLGESAMHGTHVAGIIGATRNNGIGMDGVADVELMILRVTAGKGDEYDKDVANAIRYAVENGANIINMSFGKSFSPHQEWVYKAMKLAEKKGVLIVHAAGNANSDIDKETVYPTPQYANKKALTNVITVGSIAPDGHPAISSNYGQKNVDLFAPGVDIYSTVPDGNYKKLGGTSMAAPVVTGVAALVWNYFPELNMKTLKKILLESVTSRRGEEVQKPKPRILAGPRELIKFDALCTSGGILNAYQAVQMADKLSQNK